MSDKGKSETAKREEEILAFWKKDKTFEKSLTKHAPKGEFIFYDGPPFATGLPHHGSLLSSIIKDVVPRYKTMRGYRVPRRWGWDCHGLPIESLIEKRLNLKTKKDILDIGIDTFNNAARASVLEFEHEWEKYINRVGRWVDFKNSYKTMDNSYIESVWWVLKRLNDKGLLYEGRKVLMYCPHCETPLAKAEIAQDNTYKDVTEEAVTVKFKVKSPEKRGLPPNTYLLAWTTTPWTLPGNVALAVGKDIEYVLFEKKDGHFLSAKLTLQKSSDLQASQGQTFAWQVSPTEFLGKDLVGLEYEPLFDVSALQSKKSYKVYAAKFVTTEEGTGIVHTAVMYGEDDYALGQKEGLPQVQLLTPSGTFNDRAPVSLRGEYIKKAEKIIKANLEERGLLFAKEMHTHSYPHCYRCGTPLIYNAVPSWFINIQKVKAKMLSENERITWVPEHLGRGRFKNIVENAPDWTISRNRFWASPLPIWKCKKCQRIEIIGGVEELKARAQQPVPDSLDLHRPWIDAFTFACSCGDVMHRISEVVDCWVESGAMPYASNHYPFENKNIFNPGHFFGLFSKRFPADFIAEYIGQTRTWFYYMLAVGTALFGRSSFKSVVSTGNLLAADGTKLSKSKGNFTDPLLLLDQYGADAYRFYLVGSVVMQAEDLQFRDEDVREAHNRCVGILWNSYKFFELYKGEYAGNAKAFESQHVLDRWVLALLGKTTKTVTDAMEVYDTPTACRASRAFIEDYSTWYVRRSRDRVKGDDQQDKQYTLATQKYVLETVAKLLAPLTPFVAESVYQGVQGGKESVHLKEWPEANTVDEGLLKDMMRIRELASKGLELRERAGIKIRQPLTVLKVKSLPQDASLLAVLGQEVNVKEVLEDPTLEGDVWLDTALTPELREEGIVRGLVRRVQEWRKLEGITIADRPSYTLVVRGEEKTIAEKYREQIAKETGLKELTIAE
jgi:isoleucyl-tRNA synthetase